MRYILLLLVVICFFLGREHAYAQTALTESNATTQPQPLFMRQLETALIDALSQQGVDGNLRIDLIGDQQELLRSLYFGDAELGEVSISNVNPNNGYFAALAEITPRQLGHKVMVSLQGEYEDIVNIPVLKNRITKGSIIHADDIVMLQKDSRLVRGDMVTGQDGLIGKMAKRNILPGKPISARVISEPILVNKGDHVTLLYDSSAIHLRTVGVALEEGEWGMLIPVRNSSSGVVVHGKVKGKGEVAISPMATDDKITLDTKD